VKKLALLLATFAFGPACSWASFDNLAGETWVDSAGPPKGTDTTTFGANVAAGGARPANGGMQALVIGRVNPDISRLAYDSNGVVSQSDGGDILTTLQFQRFDDPHPAMAGDPQSSIVAFSLVTRGGKTTGTGTGGDPNANTKVIFYDAGPDGPKFITQHEPGPDLKAAKIAGGLAFGEVSGDAQHSDVLIAREDEVMIMTDWALPEGTVNGNPSTFKISSCRHNEPTSFSIGLGEFDATNPGQEILISTGPLDGSTGPSKIKAISPASVLAYGGGPVASCFDLTHPVLFEIDKSSSNIVDLGKQMVVTDFGTTASPLPAIVASAPAENKLFIFTGEHGANEVDVPAPSDAGSLGAALAVGDLDGDGVPEVAVGAPKSTADGVTDAGSVFVFKWNGTGLDLVATLHDASPDVEQHFGQSVAIVPFGSGTQNVLVAGSENEVFTYFRLSPLYQDVRAGRAP
jgi:hypothetical protein